jgi:hypothetical protein
MFIGLGTSTAGIQKTGGGGPTSNPNVVGTSNDGNYPTGIESGDLVIVFATKDTPFSIPMGFTSLTSGNNGGNYYHIASLTAAGSESGSIGITALSVGCLVTRNQASSTIVTMVNNGSSWAMLTGLNTNSMIVAAGYSTGAKQSQRVLPRLNLPALLSWQLKMSQRQEPVTVTMDL